MLGMIKSFFKKEMAVGSKNRLKDAAHTDKLQVATCALLLEIAHTDNEFDAEEKRHILETMKEHFHLSTEAADKLIELSEKERTESIDLWQFTQLIKNHYSVEQKTRLIEMVWRVIYVDGTLDKHEDYLVHKLARLLGLSHEQLIETKVKVLKQGLPGLNDKKD